MTIYTFLMDLNSINQLKTYISGILSGLNSISYEGRNVNLIFNNTLSIEDKIILENAMNNYNNPVENVVISSIEPQIILNRFCSNTSYLLISKNVYNINSTKFLESVDIDVSISSINKTYNLRLYDINNNIILGELLNLNNVNKEIKKINLTVPTTNTIIELQCCVSSNKAICDIIGCYYNYY